MMEVKRFLLFEKFQKVRGEPDYKEKLVEFVKGELNLTDPGLDWENQAVRVIKRFIYKCNEKLAKPSICHHHIRFKDTYHKWLAQSECFVNPAPDTSATQKRGRPRESEFKDLGESSKRKRTQSMRQEKSADEIAHATHMKLREEGKGQAAHVVKKTVEASPRTLNILYTAIDRIRRTESGNIDDGSPKEFSLPEAVAHQLECDFTKEQYILNRQRLINKNCKVFPSYESIFEYKKFCYPQNMVITEKKAAVSLQSLLDHTVSRIMTVQEDVMKCENIVANKLEMISKLGFDGSSGHSRYNQVWKELNLDDNAMVLTGVVPLLLHQELDDIGKDIIVWMNQRPSSVLNCRLLELEFTKESTAFIKAKAKELQQFIDNLEVSIVKINGIVFEVSHNVQITMIDGKVSSSITNTAAQSCNICKATPSQMNNIDALLRRTCDTHALKYGVSVLHANIRFLEYFMSLAVRKNNVEKGYCRYTTEEKNKIANKHKEICNRLKNELGLLIDQPSPKGGNTNTGNNARRFFESARKVAEITGLDLNILERCRTVLKTLSCGYAVDTEAFQKYCIDLARDLVHKDMYGFWYMPASVHTVLIHGAAFIRALPVPIGMLSEEPLESCHKKVRELRLHHARKNRRVNTMTDIFKCHMVSTDPVIASFRRPPKPKGKVDQEVVKLLLAATNKEPAYPLNNIIDEEDSDIDDPA